MTGDQRPIRRLVQMRTKCKVLTTSMPQLLALKPYSCNANHPSRADLSNQFPENFLRE